MGDGVADSSDVSAQPVAVIKPWTLRSASVPWIPGSPDQIIERLTALLRQIQQSPSVDERLVWPDGGGETMVRAAVRAMGRSGLIVRGTGGSVELTPDAAAWLQSQSTFDLMAILHRNVRFFGEILVSIKQGAKTHEELRRVAASDYNLPWETLDQVRRRTSWFRSVHFIELWSTNELVISAEGESFLNKITVAEPDELNPADTDVDDQSIALRPGSRIAAELTAMDQQLLHARKRAIGYIPGGDPIDALQQLVSLADAPISRERFEELSSQEFDIAASSARSALAAIRAANLLEQVGPTTFTISPQAREWIESDDPLDLVRIFHCAFLGTLELLPIMDDTIGTAELARRLETEYGIARLSTDEVARRIRIFEAAGLVQRVTQMSCRRTSLGEAFACTAPLLDKISNSGTTASVSESLTASNSEEFDGEATASNTIAAITRELLDSSLDNVKYERLERATAAALELVGFSARHIGGPGNTDVLVTAWLGPGSSRTIAVDAKTASSGTRDSIDFDVLRDHRKKHGASTSVVVGPGFDERTIGWASDHEVALITARQLATVVALQTAYPLPLPELAQIFNVGGISSLEDRWAAVKRQDEILADVVDRLWKSANNTGHVEASGGALTARDLWLMMTADEKAASEDELHEILNFLANPLINAAEVRRIDRGQAYVSMSPPSVVAARIAALRNAIRSAPLNLPSVEIETLPPSSRPSIGSLPRARRARAERETVPDPAEVRRWARSQGINVAHRGRLPSHLVERYRQSTAEASPDH